MNSFPDTKKVVVVVGTRPNFIKITQLEKEFQKFHNKFDYILVHTGQHFDKKMSSVFFDQLLLMKPTYHLGVQEKTRALNIEKMIDSVGDVLQTERPDLIIVVGDVDSTYAAAKAAKKLKIKIAHLESGLRSFDNEMPEEVNRIAVDRISDLFFVTEESGLTNLANEGVDSEKIHFVGNTMIDTLINFDQEIKQDDILNRLGLIDEKYVLITMHRPKNVDNENSLRLILELISELTTKLKVVIPIHPRTLKNITLFGLEGLIENNKNLHLLGPIEYLAFQNLILNATLVMTDSGGIQEETTYRKVPCLTIRENTERPSTIDMGSNELVELNKALILSKVNAICDAMNVDSKIPPLWDGKATQRIVSILNDVL